MVAGDEPYRKTGLVEALLLCLPPGRFIEVVHRFTAASDIVLFRYPQPHQEKREHKAEE